MEKHVICQNGLMKKRTLSFTEDGALSINGQPVTVGDAIDFYRECQKKGKIAVGLPLVFQRIAEERIAEQIRARYAPEIAQMESRVEKNELELAEKRQKLAELDSHIKSLEEELAGEKRKARELWGSVDWLNQYGTHDANIDKTKEKRDNEMAASTAATDAVMTADRLPREQVFQLLARLSEGDTERGAAL
jgi:septal ring factor EnvC (AmiA/AmiB activator)